MPYLNWRETPVELDLRDHARLGAEFVARVPASELPALVEALADIFRSGRPGRELRLDLPRGWLLFFKLRESESRLLIAHPQPEEWVGTLALEAAHGEALIERLGRAGAGERVLVSELFAVGGVSNFELALEIA